MRVFVDTNLLLDVLARREPFYTVSARVWTLAETGACEALISAISFNNIYYIVRKARDTATARRALIPGRGRQSSPLPDQAAERPSTFLNPLGRSLPRRPRSPA